jgi:ATP-binding cassette, subfamily C (CFTR/MRP), member 1
VLQFFFFITILLDLPRVRTQWLLDDNTIVAAVFTITFVLRVPLLFIESAQKWRYATTPGEEIPPEERQGIFGRTFFWWLNPLFKEGYSKNLTMDDLYAIDDEIKGSVLYERLRKSWNSGRYASREPRQLAC